MEGGQVYELGSRLTVPLFDKYITAIHGVLGRLHGIMHLC